MEFKKCAICGEDYWPGSVADKPHCDPDHGLTFSVLHRSAANLDDANERSRRSKVRADGFKSDEPPASRFVIEFWGDHIRGFTKHPRYRGLSKLETLWQFICLRQWKHARLAAWDYLRGRKPERVTFEEYCFLRWGDPEKEIAEFNRRRREELGG